MFNAKEWDFYFVSCNMKESERDYLVSHFHLRCINFMEGKKRKGMLVELQHD